MKKLVFPLLVALAACDSSRSTTAETADPAQLRATTTPAAPASAVTFRKELRHSDFRFLVQTTGEGAQQQLSLHTEKKGRTLATTTQQLEGRVSDVVVTNLNQNDFPELLIFVSDAGSGSYGQLLGFEYQNQGRRAVTLPGLGGPAAKGYQGHDTFEVVGQQVLRHFPVYQEEDANCCPSGGTRTIHYQLPRMGLVFKQVAFENSINP
jgi:hypothetical protein